MKIRIATRVSQLALLQSEWVKAQLIKQVPGVDVEMVGIKTQGDKLLDKKLNKIGGKGLFVKELEEAIYAGKADIAVHSCKDIPMELPQHMVIAAIFNRIDPRDAFVSNQYTALGDLKQGATIGTSSLRRQAQLAALRPDLNFKMLRGNLITRLEKLDSGEFDAIVLAVAGLQRLGLASRISQYLEPEVLLPAVGQGALAIECLNESKIKSLIMQLNEPLVAACVNAERAMNYCLKGSCQVPVAGFAQVSAEILYLRGLVATPDGRQLLRAEQRGLISDGEKIGTAVGQELLGLGADKILRSLAE